MGRWPTGQSVTRWNHAYADHTAALFSATAAPDDPQATQRLSRAYRTVAQAWKALALDESVPLWARHGAIFAAESFDQKARALETGFRQHEKRDL